MARFAGACAVIGGSAWTAASIIHASRPRGCVGDECVAVQMRMCGRADARCHFSHVALQELVYVSDFRWMPAFVVPGITALAVGLALVGWTVVRSRVVPSWVGVSLLVGALLRDQSAPGSAEPTVGRHL